MRSSQLEPQAIYLHAGDADLAVSPFTSDGDIAVDPSVLQPEPALGSSLEAAGFERTDVGIWSKSELAEDVRTIVTVDLLVPESVGGDGRRGARLVHCFIRAEARRQEFRDCCRRSCGADRCEGS